MIFDLIVISKRYNRGRIIVRDRIADIYANFYEYFIIEMEPR